MRSSSRRSTRGASKKTILNDDLTRLLRYTIACDRRMGHRLAYVLTSVFHFRNGRYRSINLLLITNEFSVQKFRSQETHGLILHIFCIPSSALPLHTFYILSSITLNLKSSTIAFLAPHSTISPTQSSQQFSLFLTVYLAVKSCQLRGHRDSISTSPFCSFLLFNISFENPLI